MTKDEFDLAEIEKTLLPDGCFFDGQRRKFIFDNTNSIDLIACAGSGKTTALLAKLLLLERRENKDRGICVLTHTNVAINEVKNKISDDSGLLQFPNNFSTIQQFVDRYLTIPAYRHLTGHNLKQIDTEAANKRFINNLYHLPDSVEKRALFNYRELGETWKDRKMVLERGVEYIIEVGAGHFQLTGNYKNRKITLNNPDSKSFKAVKRAKNPVFFEGYITYDEAYSLARWYLDKFPFIENCLSERFSHVFVDEMQDSSQIQIDLLTRVFARSSTVIQRIGDPNQSIYDTSSEGLCEWIPIDSKRSLTGSLRLSTSIVEAVSGVRMDCSDGLHGNSSIPNIKPYIITFKDGEEANVVNEYKRVLEKHWDELDYSEGDQIKIVGWTGKDNDDLCLPRYMPSFSSPTSKKYLPNFESYKSHFESHTRNKNALKYSRSIILLVTSQLLFELRIMKDGKYYSQSEVEQTIETDIEKHQKLFDLSLRLAYSESTWSTIKFYISDELLPLFSVTDANISTEKLDAFLHGDSEASNQQQGTIKEELLLVEGRSVLVPITTSTIHAVKGETHKSTLYVETKYFKYDIERLLQMLCGRLEKRDNHDGKRQMMGYVAMSRASHLLCLAVRDSAVDQEMETILGTIGWQVLRI